MGSQKEEFFSKAEARKLWIAAEVGFFRCMKDDVYPMGALPGPIEAEKRSCLQAGFPKEVINDVLIKAWQMARRRYEARKGIFVAASLTGGREALPYVKFVTRFVEKQGYTVLSQHNGADNPVKTFLAQVGNPLTYSYNLFRDTDNIWIYECGLLIAELTTPSHGVGGEWENCRLKPQLGSFLTPMLGLSLEGRKVSPYVTGITEEEKAFIWLRSYRNEDDLAKALSEFLGEFG